MFGQRTLEALRLIPPTGKAGFEGLVRDLIAQLSGTSLRLCQAGCQGDIDALAKDIPVAVQFKRYSAKGKLDLGGLGGELAAAARSYMDIQLWVLGCAVEVPAQAFEALEVTAGSLGLAVLFIDANNKS